MADSLCVLLHLRVVSSESEIEFADQRLRKLAHGRFSRRAPVRAPHGHEKALLLEIFLEHVERFAQQLDGAILIGRMQHAPAAE